MPNSILRRILWLILLPSIFWNSAQAQVAIVTHPGSQSNFGGQFVSLTVGANVPSNRPYALQWQKDGVNLASSTHFQGAVRTFDNPSGTFATAQLMIPDLQDSDAGNYRAIFHLDGLSYTSNPANISLKTYVSKKPFIRSVAADQAVPAGTSFVTLRSQISASPDTTYQWFKDGVALPDEKEANALGYYRTKGRVSGDGDTFFDFVISPVRDFTFGKYKMVLTSPLGTAESREIVVSQVAGTGPAFTTQPKQSSVVAKLGDGVTVDGYAATGLPTPTLYLAKNGVTLGFANAFSTQITSYAQASDAGTYTIVASNSVGQVVSNPINLVVGTPPENNHVPTPMPCIASADQIRGATLKAVVFFGVDDHPNPNTYEMQFAASGNTFTFRQAATCRRKPGRGRLT